MKNLDTVYTDASCYESLLRFQTDVKLLWGCVKRSYKMIAVFVSEIKNEKIKVINGLAIPQGLSDQELAVWYNDHIIYPDKVRLNCYYYRYYNFIKDIQMIFATVLGKKIEYAGEVI